MFMRFVVLCLLLVACGVERDPGVDERVGDAQVAAAHDAEHDVRPRARQRLPDRLRDPRHGAGLYRRAPSHIGRSQSTGAATIAVAPSASATTPIESSA